MNQEQREIIALLVGEFEEKVRAKVLPTLKPHERLELDVFFSGVIVELGQVNVNFQDNSPGLLKRYTWKKAQRRAGDRPATIEEVTELLSIVKSQGAKKLIQLFIDNSNRPVKRRDLNAYPQPDYLKKILRTEHLAIELIWLEQGLKFWILKPPEE